MTVDAPSIHLFERSETGHFPLYVRAIASELGPAARVAIAGSDGLLERVSDLPAELIPLGAARGRPRGAGGEADPADLAREEIELIRQVCSAHRPDHLFHLYGDPVLRWLGTADPIPSRVSTIVFHPTWHYPRAYATRLTPRRRLSAGFLEYKLRRWMRRPDAHAVLTTDRVAARRWATTFSGRAHWLPDPPVRLPEAPPSPERRRGCILYGAFERRKGLGLLADALVLRGPPSFPVVLAGFCLPGYEPEFERQVERMRTAGIEVDVRRSRPDADVGPAALAEVSCVVLPYHRFPAHSRVMTEAATLGVPVVGPDYGLMGHLIRGFGIGLAVNVSDPIALGDAVATLADDPDAPSRYAENLRRYAAAATAGFGPTLRTAFAVD